MRICVLLEDEHRVANSSSSSTIDVPTKSEILNALEISVNTDIPNANPCKGDEYGINVNEMCEVVW